MFLWTLCGLPTPPPEESQENDHVLWEEEEKDSPPEETPIANWELHGMRFFALSQELARKNFERNRRLMRLYMETFTKVPYGN